MWPSREVGSPMSCAVGSHCCGAAVQECCKSHGGNPPRSRMWSPMRTRWLFQSAFGRLGRYVVQCPVSWVLTAVGQQCRNVACHMAETLLEGRMWSPMRTGWLFQSAFVRLGKFGHVFGVVTAVGQQGREVACQMAKTDCLPTCRSDTR